MENAIRNIGTFLVEDNIEGANLVRRSLRKNNLGNSVQHVTDGLMRLIFFLKAEPIARIKYI